jgi:hypothetical protein
MNTANTFNLQGHHLHINYSSTSFGGMPLLTYQDSTQTLDFIGDQIRTVDTEIGKLVTVTIALTIDRGSTSFTLLVPNVNLGSSNLAHVNTDAITTIHRSAIDPKLVQGQTEIYSVTKLSGTATFVVS